MQTVKKKRLCIVGASVGICLLLFWQAPALYYAEGMDLYAVFGLFISVFLFSFSALFYELRQDNEVLSEITSLRSDLRVLHEKIDSLQSRDHETVSSPFSPG